MVAGPSVPFAAEGLDETTCGAVVPLDDVGLEVVVVGRAGGVGGSGTAVVVFCASTRCDAATRMHSAIHETVAWRRTTGRKSLLVVCVILVQAIQSSDRALGTSTKTKPDS